MSKPIIPIAIATAVVGAGVAVLLGKNKDSGSSEKKSTGVTPIAKPTSSTRERKNESELSEGTYTFLSGLDNPVTVDLSMKYDPVRYDYSIKYDGYIANSSVTHAIVILGEDFSLQMEYADIFNGKGFEKAMEELGEKYKGIDAVSYGSNKGYKYADGDSMCIALSVENAPECYLLITIVKEQKCDVEFTDLPDNVDVIEMLSSIKMIAK